MIAWFATAAAQAQDDLKPVAFAVVHHTDVQWEHRVIPRYPREASDLELGPVMCRVRLFVEADGALDHVDFVSCPRVFQDPVLAAVTTSRWRPWTVKDTPVPFQFVLIYSFIDDARGAAEPDLLNALPTAEVWAEWCRDVRVPLDAFASVPPSEVTWQVTPALHVPGDASACRATLYVDPRGRPVYVAVTATPEDWGYRIATSWCASRIDRQDPPDAVMFSRACEP